jgi:flagellar biosynthesis protein FliR
MRPVRLVIALLVALVGLAWIGQGTGLIAGSAMSGTLFWAVVGLVLLGVAVGIVVRERQYAATH